MSPATAFLHKQGGSLDGLPFSSAALHQVSSSSALQKVLDLPISRELAANQVPLMGALRFDPY